MGLPADNSPWPPEGWEDVYKKYREHAAWYSGDPRKLSNFYSQTVYTPTPRGRFWATKVDEERRTMLHIPIAGDIAGASADLLFGEETQFKIPEAHDTKDSGAKKTQERLEEIIHLGDVPGRLLEAAENAAAMGGVFLKVNWDEELSDVPILSIVQADAVIPEFKWGLLVAVNCWKNIENDGHIYWRHLERREGGKIGNALYKGDASNIGRQMTLTAHPYTEEMAEEIDMGIEDSLGGRYIPNMRPNRLFRGSAIGQSDYAGVEGMMDALDEVWTSWMRDIRLGKGRIPVPEEWLEIDEEGNKTFDIDREVFTTLKDIDPNSRSQGWDINGIQFDIRTQEHERAAMSLVERIITSAGYSPQTFGLHIEGRAETGTALNIRERKTFITKAKKQRYWESLADLMHIMLQIDRAHLGGQAEPMKPQVEFDDSLRFDLNEQAETVRMIEQAKAASIYTRVSMLHPDWTQDQVEAEVQRIQEEEGLAVEGPDQIGID